MKAIFEDATDTAKKIRRELKKNFPNYKGSHFKVKTEKYAGGSSIRVSWEDTPSKKEVDEIVMKFESANFDGMEDLETLHGYTDLEDGQVYSGAKYIFTNMEISDEKHRKIIDYLDKNFDDFKEEDLSKREWTSRYNDLRTKDMDKLQKDEKSEEDKKESKDNKVDLNEYREKKDEEELKITDEDKKDVLTIVNKKAKENMIPARDLSRHLTTKYLKELKRNNKGNFLQAMELDIDGKVKELSKEELSKKEEEKEFNSNREISEEVIKHLIEGEVNLVFYKSNGAERKMRATRNENILKEYENLYSAFKEGNQEENIGKELNQGTISVVDLDIEGGGARKFVTERLVSYQPKGSSNIKVVKKENKEDGDNKHYNPVQKLKTEDMIKALSKKVVRLVFEKKDGSNRVMIGTRNPNIVGLYVGLDNNGKRPVNRIKDDRESDIQSQIDKDYVKLLDVEKQSFRTFKPSKVVEYDEDLNIGSWIEFNENNDAWYDLAFNGADPREYYKEGSKIGVKKEGDLPEKVSYEREQKIKLRDEEMARETMEKSRKQAEEKTEKEKEAKTTLETVHTNAMSIIKQIPDDIKSDNFKGIYEDILKVPDKLSKDKAFNNMENKINGVQKNDKNQLMIIQIGKDSIYLHPLFIVNGYSGRVYIDKTPKKVFSNLGEVLDRDADWGSEDVLETVVNKIKKLSMQKKEKKNKEKEEDEEDKIRFDRMMKLVEEGKEDYNKKGIKLSERNMEKQGISLLQARVGGRIFLIHPSFAMEVQNGKANIIFRVKTNSRVKEYTSFLRDLIESANNEKEQELLKELSNLVIHSIDLRKRVK